MEVQSKNLGLALPLFLAVFVVLVLVLVCFVLFPLLFFGLRFFLFVVLLVRRLLLPLSLVAVVIMRLDELSGKLSPTPIALQMFVGALRLMFCEVEHLKKFLNVV